MKTKVLAVLFVFVILASFASCGTNVEGTYKEVDGNGTLVFILDKIEPPPVVGFSATFEDAVAGAALLVSGAEPHELKTKTIVPVRSKAVIFFKARSPFSCDFV